MHFINTLHLQKTTYSPENVHAFVMQNVRAFVMPNVPRLSVR